MKSDKSAVQALFTFEPDIYYRVPHFKFVHHINISENVYQCDDGSDAGHLSSQPENKHGKKFVDATKRYDREQLFAGIEALELVKSLAPANSCSRS